MSSRPPMVEVDWVCHWEKRKVRMWLTGRIGTGNTFEGFTGHLEKGIERRPVGVGGSHFRWGWRGQSGGGWRGFFGIFAAGRRVAGGGGWRLRWSRLVTAGQRSGIEQRLLPVARLQQVGACGCASGCREVVTVAVRVVDVAGSTERWCGRGSQAAGWRWQQIGRWESYIDVDADASGALQRVEAQRLRMQTVRPREMMMRMNRMIHCGPAERQQAPIGI